MKKKIRDLTLYEAKAICDKHTIECYGCPLYQTPKCVEYDEKELKQRLEQEIEIEE